MAPSNALADDLWIAVERVVAAKRSPSWRAMEAGQ
jgi:hypothetical protein